MAKHHRRCRRLGGGTTMARIPVDYSADEMPAKVLGAHGYGLESDRKSIASDDAALREFLAPDAAERSN